MENNLIINIGRQLGSGGREIGEKLANRLNVRFYDKELIELASKQSGLCTDFFEKADEKPSQGIIGNFLGMGFPFINEGAVSSLNCLNNDSLFKIQSDVIRQLAKTDSCIFVGRCSDYILREHINCINIFITANHEDRINRVQQLYSISESEAENKIEQSDKKRANYYNYYSYKAWGMASSYHLCINSSVLGIDGTIEFIEDFIQRRTAK